jgi:hypothetical protein
MPRLSRENHQASLLAFAGGTLLIIARLSGVTFWSPVAQDVADALGVPVWVFLPLLIIAALGGVSVIIGGFLFRKSRVDFGTVFIALGVGVDFIGLVVGVAGVVHGRSGALGAASVLGLIGVVMSIVARMRAKRPGK